MITRVLHKLHWLPIIHCISYKILTITCKVHIWWGKSVESFVQSPPLTCPTIRHWSSHTTCTRQVPMFQQPEPPQRPAHQNKHIWWSCFPVCNTCPEQLPPLISQTVPIPTSVQVPAEDSLVHHSLSWLTISLSQGPRHQTLFHTVLLSFIAPSTITSSFLLYIITSLLKDHCYHHIILVQLFIYVLSPLPFVCLLVNCLSHPFICLYIVLLCPFHVPACKAPLGYIS